MKRIFLVAALLALLVPAAFPARSEAAVSVGVSLHVGDPYRGLSLQFRSQPDMALIPASRVYYARSYDRDLYRYGRDWYYVEDDCWYRASSYRGPFVRVDVTSVPRDIWNVPPRYKRTWSGAASQGPSYGYRRSQDQSGYGRDWNQGGYGRDSNQGGYGRSNQGGYNNDRGQWQERNDRRVPDRETDRRYRTRDRYDGKSGNDRNDRDGRYGSR